MDAEHAGEQAHAKAIELLDKLMLSEEERDTVRTLYMRMLTTVGKSRKVWDLIKTGSVRLDVIPCAAAMLTAYSDEMMRAVVDGGESPDG